MARPTRYYVRTEYADDYETEDCASLDDARNLATLLRDAVNGHVSIWHRENIRPVDPMGWDYEEEEITE